MKKGDNLYQIGKQRERNDQKTGESNSDTSCTWEKEKTTNRKSIMNRKNMMVHVLPIPPISFPFRFALQGSTGTLAPWNSLFGSKVTWNPEINIDIAIEDTPFEIQVVYATTTTTTATATATARAKPSQK